ncbi:MAG: laminin B domain-containing protein [Terriglobia bacterium]
MLFVSPLLHAGVISNFTTDNQGWTSVTFANVSSQPDFGSVPASSAVTWNAAGGNPGGYISKQDPDGNWQYFSAPAAFLGNQSSALGGSFLFDEILINNFGQPNLNPQGPLAALSNGTVTLVYGGNGGTAAISGTNWNSFSLALNAASWKVSTPNGAQATAAQISSVLSNLTGVYILSDFWTGSGASGEILGIDNVNLTSATPEPGSAALGLTGCLMLGICLRRRSRT